ncbi:MAG: heme-binding protein [Rhodobacteraceae bacterium]|nr:heme-binding protein [Paracoccaceae bacterium]
MTLSLAAARIIITQALAKGRAAGMKPLSVLVVDAGGHPIAFEREDTASAGRYVIAMGKANACLMMGIGGAALQERAEKDPAFMGALTGAYGGAFLPRKGGLLVRDATGAVLGAVGVTGCTSDNDALAGTAGIEAAGLVAEG